MFSEVQKAATKGALSHEQLADETPKACLMAVWLSVDALDRPMVRRWVDHPLKRNWKEGSEE